MMMSLDPASDRVLFSRLITVPLTVPPELPVMVTSPAMIDPLTVPKLPANVVRNPGARTNDPVRFRRVPYDEGSVVTSLTVTLPEKLRMFLVLSNVTPFSTMTTPLMVVFPENSRLFGAFTYSTPLMMVLPVNLRLVVLEGTVTLVRVCPAVPPP